MNSSATRKTQRQKGLIDPSSATSKNISDNRRTQSPASESIENESEDRLPKRRKIDDGGYAQIKTKKQVNEVILENSFEKNSK